MYQTIYELPSQVQAALNEKDQSVWMEAYNSLFPQTEEEIKEAKKRAWHACKDLPSSFSFHIWATVEAVDKDREVVDVKSVADHMDSFLEYGGNAQWEHGNYTVATIWDWEQMEVDGKPGIAVWGNVFGGDKVYDQMRQTFIDGKNSLSIAGEADKGHFVCDEKGCYTKRDVKQIMEISFCEEPSNKYCTLIWYNKDAALAKSASKDKGVFARADVQGYEIHRDEGSCPICQLRDSLQKSGYPNARTTRAGVKIDMDLFDYLEAMPRLKASGNYVEWTGNGILVQDYRTMLEKAFKEGHSLGYIDDNGCITEAIAKSQFAELYNRGMLERTVDGGYKLRRHLRCLRLEGSSNTCTRIHSITGSSRMRSSSRSMIA